MAKVIKEDLDTKNNGTAAEASLAPNSKPSGGETRSQLLASAVAAMGGMDHGDLTKFAESLKMNTGENQSKVLDGDQSKSRASITPKGVAAQAMKEDVVDMFKGQEGMTEELIEKATIVFEAAVNARVGMEVVRIQEELDTKNEETLKTEITAINEELINKIDTYLSSIVADWAKENQVAIDESIAGQIAIDFLKAQKKLFKEHYIKIPKKKLDVVEQLATENADLQKRLDEVTKLKIEQEGKLNTVAKNQVVESASVGLSVTQVEKLKQLVEGVEFDNVDSFTNKVSILKQNYFKVAPKSKDLLTEGSEKEVLVNDKGEHVDAEGNVIAAPEAKSTNPEMDLYNRIINRQVAKI